MAGTNTMGPPGRAAMAAARCGYSPMIIPPVAGPACPGPAAGREGRPPAWPGRLWLSPRSGTAQGKRACAHSCRTLPERRDHGRGRAHSRRIAETQARQRSRGSPGRHPSSSGTRPGQTQTTTAHATALQTKPSPRITCPSLAPESLIFAPSHLGHMLRSASPESVRTPPILTRGTPRTRFRHRTTHCPDTRHPSSR
jgi:hypothetical protein